MLVDVRDPVSREAKPSAAHPGRIVFHPRYERFLRRCGIDSSESVFALRGEIICGHPDRHVARVELGSRVIFLKREHVVGLRTRFRNRLARFGWVSRSEREAMTLRALEEAGLPGPQWLAYGEDDAGRAFLLVDELSGMQDLTTLLSDNALTPDERRELAERLGHTLAELHAAGFGTPELAAKHVLVNPETLATTLIDWQSSVRRPLTEAKCVRQLAGLNASLADDLATPRERLRFVWMYWRNAHSNQTSFAEFAREIAIDSRHKERRSSARDQRQLHPAPRLVWLAEEAVCVIPELVAEWPQPAVCEPFYPTHAAIDEPTTQEHVTFPSGRRGLVTRFTNTDPIGRLVAAARERPWRSPSTVAARILIHLQRCGISAPRLLAFGQRTTSPMSAQSFVLYEPLPKSAPLARRSLLRECGLLLRRLHDADCRITTAQAFVVANGSVGVESPFAVRLTKNLNYAARCVDLRRLVRGMSRTDHARVVRAYLGESADRVARKALLARLV